MTTTMAGDVPFGAACVCKRDIGIERKRKREGGKDMQGRSALQSDPNPSLVIRPPLAFRQQWGGRGVGAAWTSDGSPGQKPSWSGASRGPHLDRLGSQSLVHNLRCVNTSVFRGSIYTVFLPYTPPHHHIPQACGPLG